MLVSVDSCADLPVLRQIHHILIVNTNVMFICREMIAWYYEHLRSYEVCKSSWLSSAKWVIITITLSAYRVKGQLMVTLKHYILCWCHILSESWTSPGHLELCLMKIIFARSLSKKDLTIWKSGSVSWKKLSVSGVSELKKTWSAV